MRLWALRRACMLVCIARVGPKCERSIPHACDGSKCAEQHVRDRSVAAITLSCDATGTRRLEKDRSLCANVSRASRSQFVALQT